MLLASLGDRLRDERDAAAPLSVLGKSAGAGEGDLNNVAESRGDLRSSDGEVGGSILCCGEAGSGLGDLSLIAGACTVGACAAAGGSEALPCSCTADQGVGGRSSPA